MPKGKKTCPSCSSEHGVRTKVCPCGHSFGFKPKEDVEESAKEVAQDTSNTVLSNEELQSLLVPSINIPSGEPPFVPKGYKGGSKPVWKTSEAWGEPALEEDITEWADKLRDHYDSQNKKLENSAIRYFARYFWDISSPEFKRVCDIIDKAQTKENLQTQE